MKLKYLLKGFIKSIPGIEYLYKFNKKTGGTNKARYCYSVWLRHLVLAHKNGHTAIPKRIVELGPGDSLGVGLAALICGANFYMALDVVRFTNIEANLVIFDELVALFKQRTPIPDAKEFPHLWPDLSNYEFPAYIFTPGYMEKMLDEKRVNSMRESIKSLENPDKPVEGNMIVYEAPWKDDNKIEKGSIDMVYTQTVLQHFTNLQDIYGKMYGWLKKDGIMSHMIDLTALKFSDSWDGHWTYSDFEWKLVAGRNSVGINREPHSAHIKYLNDLHFNIICDIKLTSAPIIKRKNLAKKYKNMSEEDLSISSIFIQAVK